MTHGFGDAGERGGCAWTASARIVSSNTLVVRLSLSLSHQLFHVISIQRIEPGPD
jgi:hypothetical protein